MNYVITLYRDGGAVNVGLPVQRFNADTLSEARVKFNMACETRFATKVELSVILDTWRPQK